MPHDPVFGIAAAFSLLPLLVWSWVRTGIVQPVFSGGMFQADREGNNASRPTDDQDKAGAAFWVCLGIAVPVCFGTSFTLLDNHWQAGLTPTLWVTLTACLLLLIPFVLVSRDGWRLLPLLTPCLALTALFAAALGWSPEQQAAGHDIVAPGPGMILHIAFSVLTYALLTLAAVSGLAVFLRERGLKRKKSGRLLRALPSVADAQRYQFHLLVLSEILLGLGLLTGMAVEYETRGVLLEVSHKILFSFITFCVIALLLLAHMKAGIRGRKAARYVLLAWLFLTIGFPGVKFVTDILLH